MSETKHENSHIITIFRAGSTLSRAQGKDVEEMFSMARMSIGSYFKKNSMRVGSGMDFDEEEIILPLILDVPADDKEFRKKVTEFYEMLDSEVPHDTGLQLEIGLKGSNKEPISKNNRPINPLEYVRYRHAKGHPEVAESKEAAKGNSLKKYYIFDPKKLQEKSTKRNEEKDAAMQIYLELKQDPAKVDMMLTLLGIDPREFSNSNLRTEALRQQAELNAEKFIQTKDEGELEIRYWIKTMENVGVIKNIGNKYINAETKAIIGNNLEETIYFFKDEEKSEEITVLKALMQEAVKKPYTKPKKMTQITK